MSDTIMEVLRDVKENLDSLSVGINKTLDTGATQHADLMKDCKQVIAIMSEKLIDKQDNIVDIITEMRINGLNHPTSIVLVEVLMRIRKITEVKRNDLGLLSRHEEM